MRTVIRNQLLRQFCLEKLRSSWARKRFTAWRYNIRKIESQVARVKSFILSPDFSPPLFYFSYSCLSIGPRHKSNSNHIYEEISKSSTTMNKFASIVVLYRNQSETVILYFQSDRVFMRVVMFDWKASYETRTCFLPKGMFRLNNFLGNFKSLYMKNKSLRIMGKVHLPIQLYSWLHFFTL